MSRRLLGAAVVSSAVIVFVICLGLYVILRRAIGPGEIPAGSFGHALFFFLFLGSPVAMVAVLVIGAIAIRLRGPGSDLSLGAIVLLATLFGAVLVPIVFGGTREDFGPLGTIGAIAGLSGGLVFWLVMRYGLRAMSVMPNPVTGMPRND